TVTHGAYLLQINLVSAGHRSQAAEQLHINIAADESTGSITQCKIQPARMIRAIAALAVVHGPSRLARVVLQIAQRPSVDVDFANRVGVPAQRPKRRSVWAVLRLVSFPDNDRVRCAIGHFGQANRFESRSGSLVIDNRKHAAPPAADAVDELHGLTKGE